MSVIIDDSPTDVQRLETRLAALESELAAKNALLTEHRSPQIRILKEPLTYEARLVHAPGNPRNLRAIATRSNHCYIKDLALMQTRNGNWRPSAERLERHQQEMRKIGEAREALFHPDADYEFEQRAVNWSNGQGGYFAPPLWIVEHFATVPTPERVLSEKAPKFELPQGAQSVNLPAWLSGADVDVQAVSNTATSTDTTDAGVSSAVATIAGNYDVPMQMLEQSPAGAHLDWVAFTNMESRYGYKLELQLLTGTGSATPQGSGNNQLLGIFKNTSIPSVNVINYTGHGEGTTDGATAMFGSFGLLVSKVGQSRLLPPEGWLMSTSRSAWLGSSEDLQSRPLMIADNPSDSGVWDLLGFPVWLDDALPRTSGTGMNEDRVVSCRPSDWLILESERRTSVYTDVISGTLQARLQLRRYVAALLRYPTSVAYMGGSGMATGGGF